MWEYSSHLQTVSASNCKVCQDSTFEFDLKELTLKQPKNTPIHPERVFSDSERHRMSWNERPKNSFNEAVLGGTLLLAPVLFQALLMILFQFE